MSLNLSKEKLIEITGGTAMAAGEKPPITFQGVEFDSRRIRGGELFVALAGERGHGHAHVRDALERGAALCLVEDAAACGSLSEPERVIIVQDSLVAFQQIAVWWRSQMKLPLAAVTGSMGKTTVKELTAAMLLKIGRGIYSFKSYNNHIGVPYTLCQFSSGHVWAVLEMGMNHPGELSLLSSLAAPDVAVILGVSTVHMHAFQTLDQVADAKCEIMTGLKPDAPLIINGDDAVLEAAVKRRAFAKNLKIKKVGWQPGFDSQLLDVQSRGLEGIRCRISLLGEELEFKCSMPGRHNAFNIAAAALIARSLVPHISGKQLQEAVSGFIPPRMRLNVRYVAAERILVDDTYNANPAAMRALFQLAAEVRAQGRVVGLLLGDMLELGDRARLFHREIAAEAAALRPEFIVAVGDFASEYVQAAKPYAVKVFEASSPQAAAHILHKLPFNVLFAKGSRGIGLDKAIETLLELEGELPPFNQDSFAKL